jgi:tRNA A-37 threonylcarbamoyl transferase component Bud32
MADPVRADYGAPRGNQIMNGPNRQTQLTHELGFVPDRIRQLASPSTSRAIALEVLTSPDVMRDLLQTRLPAIDSEAVTIRQCHPTVLKKRHRSSQVIAYTLNVNGGSRRELIAKRYADGSVGERAFRTMQILHERGFGAGSPLKIPTPLCYLADLKLLIQEKARGIPLREQLGRENSASARMRMVACWLAKLHQIDPIPDALGSYEEDESSLQQLVYRLQRRYPHLASGLEELASSIRQRIGSIKDAIPTVTGHGDFHPENIFVTRDGATVIDFDHSCRADPARDLGYFVAQVRNMAYFSTGSLEASNREIRAFVDVYLASMSWEDTEALAARIVAFAARTFLESMCYILVLRGEGTGLLSNVPMEVERFLRADKVEDILG